MPYIFSFRLNKIILKKRLKVNKTLDQGWRENLGAQGLFKYLVRKSSFFQILQNNDFKILLLLLLFIILFVYLNN